MPPNDVDEMANNVDPTEEQSDLGLHCSFKFFRNTGLLILGPGFDVC